MIDHGKKQPQMYFGDGMDFLHNTSNIFVKWLCGIKTSRKIVCGCWFIELYQLIVGENGRMQPIYAIPVGMYWRLLTLSLELWLCYGNMEKNCNTVDTSISSSEYTWGALLWAVVQDEPMDMNKRTLHMLLLWDMVGCKKTQVYLWIHK